MEGKTLRVKITQLSDDLAQYVYPLTYKFPREEKFALADQIRRSIVSVPANIIEGSSRGGVKEFKQFLDIAYASLKEAKYLIYFANKQKFINDSEYSVIKDKSEELSKLLFSLIKVIR